jgi:GxxExxY protein
MRNIDEVGSSNRLIFEDESYAIIGAAMDVYYRLGCGFLEPVYQEALAYEFGLRQIPFTAQTRLKIRYKDHTLRKPIVLISFVLRRSSLRSSPSMH